MRKLWKQPPPLLTSWNEARQPTALRRAAVVMGVSCPHIFTHPPHTTHNTCPCPQLTSPKHPRVQRHFFTWPNRHPPSIIIISIIIINITIAGSSIICRPHPQSTRLYTWSPIATTITAVEHWDSNKAALNIQTQSRAYRTSFGSKKEKTYLKGGKLRPPEALLWCTKMWWHLCVSLIVVVNITQQHSLQVATLVHRNSSALKHQVSRR